MKKLFCARGTGQYLPRQSHPMMTSQVEMEEEEDSIVAVNDSSNAKQRKKDNEGQRIKRLSSRVMSAAVNIVTAGAGNSLTGFTDAIEKVTPAIVVIKTNFVRTFEGSSAGSSTATGFVVDKNRGIILTNRHVMSTGPLRAEATFINKEEIPLDPLYADPVHDFAFFRFDPTKLKYMEVTQVPLSPEKAKVGLEIRVLGNDAGEQLQILGGTLARLDRDAPRYSSGVYRDFNTFYYSAASSTSGGSSGSPVIESNGHAVALNAGARTGTASSYYLPLHRIVRALRYMQNGTVVPRRTLQCVFVHATFAEATRLGLTDQVQAKVREEFPLATGMLVVDVVVPGGPAADHLKTGDILLKLNGSLIHDFLPLEEIFDDSENVTLTMQRGGKEFEVTLDLDDLHSLSPGEFLEISDGIVHPLSYHQAIDSLLPVGGVVISAPGYMLKRAHLGAGHMIMAIGDQPTPDLASFVRELSKYPDLAQVSVKVIYIRHRFREMVVSMTLERVWFLMRRAKRELVDGVITWKYSALPSPTETYSRPQRQIRFRTNEEACLVIVTFTAPFHIDGLSNSEWVGTGIVVDSEQGLIICDRSTVPNALGNATVTISNTIEVPAKVVFVHPVHNFSIVQIDTASLKIFLDDAITRTQVELSDTPLKAGDSVTFAGITPQLSIIVQRSTVTMVSRHITRPMYPPRFGAHDQISVSLDKLVQSLGGILMDDEGRVQAFWFASAAQGREISFGIPAQVIFDAFMPFKDNINEHHIYRSLAVDMSVARISEANAALGLTEEWIEDLSHTKDADHLVLSIRTVMANSNSAGILKSGDLLVAIDGVPVSQTPELEKLVHDKTKVNVTVIRDHEERVLSVQTTPFSCIGTSRVVLFAGVTLQSPHPEVALAGFLPDEISPGSEGVYCSFWYFGSPADLYGMEATSFVVAVNDVPTPTLDDFLREASKVEDSTFLRLRCYSLDGTPNVVTLKSDRYFWPTMDLSRDSKTGNWSLELIE